MEVRLARNALLVFAQLAHRPISSEPHGTYPVSNGDSTQKERHHEYYSEAHAPVPIQPVVLVPAGLLTGRLVFFGVVCSQLHHIAVLFHKDYEGEEYF